MRFTTTQRQPVETLVALQCDACGKRYEASDVFEIQEFHRIDFEAGYSSVFGDENHVACDLCQYCLQKRLGDILRLTKH